MKKTEKLIAALLMMVIGVLFIVMKDKFIGILMTIAGVSLIVLGVVDIVQQSAPPAVIKIVSGIFVIVCGWTVVEAVLYIVAAALLILGILLLYDKIKHRVICANLLYAICEYAVPIVCILLGILLLFHRGAAVNFVFIGCGILTIIEGGLILFNTFSEELF